MSCQLLDIGEIGLISRLTANMSYTKDIIIGVGDDAAAVKPSVGNLLLITTDMLVEGVHFTLPTITPYQLGWKSMAVNMSDIAAMGGISRWAVIGLGMPAHTPVSFTESLYDGIQAICQRYHTQLVGGDTVSCDKIVINITLTGEVSHENLIQRSGARVGDVIVVTNTIGDAGAGLSAIQHGLNTPSAQTVIKKHLEPIPRLTESRQIVQLLSPTAMIDISDGLSIDLCRLAEASRVGVRIYEDNLPISEAVSIVARELSIKKLYLALSGGEDYELLFTMSLQMVKALDCVDVPLTVIGEIVEFEMGQIMVASAGLENTLEFQGYEHFRALRH
ncbi:MAG: thiamine-phosphate kinase [bacterium]|nr:thiamine-phosphate kinase [bacterium]